MDAPRIPPVEKSEDTETAAELERWMPPGTGVEPLRLFRTLVTHTELSRAMRPLGSYILGRRACLEPRHREILIARVCARCRCEYEWGVHVAGLARAVGLDDEAVNATVLSGPDADCWTPAESALVQALDELHGGPALTQTTWDGLGRHFDDAQRLEILVAAGWYRLIAGVCNGLALPPEPWAARFPALPHSM